jgi:Cof subfamily protein (haloacid dehalogenase superfamily)
VRDWGGRLAAPWDVRAAQILILRRALSLPAGFPLDVEVFACDLDRTLIAKDGMLPPRTEAAIRAARGAGMRVIIATGRMFVSVRPYVLQAGIDDPVVCYQGAVVAEPDTGRWLRHEPIPVALAKEAIQAIVRDGFHVNVYVDDELFVARVTPEARAYADFQGLVIHEVGDLAAWLEKPPTKVVSVGEPALLDGLEAGLKEQFAGRLYISKSLPFFLEIASPHVTKGSGLQFVADHLRFPAEKTVAFGDGENDIELLEWAGFGIAVANAHERVLAIADYVCPPVTEEGVAQVIEAVLDSRA